MKLTIDKQNWHLWVAIAIAVLVNFYQYFHNHSSMASKNSELEKQVQEAAAERDEALKDLKIKTDSEIVARKRFEEAEVKPKPKPFTPITVSRNIHSDSLSHLLTDLYR